MPDQIWNTPTADICVGFAGVTRPNRPGIDVNVEPPAVRMNDELGGILTFKLKVLLRTHIRESPTTLSTPWLTQRNLI